MLLGRTIQGIGGGGIILLNDIVMTDLVPMRLRGIYSGIIGGIWALGSVSGPVIGGALASKADWVGHICFLFCFCFFVLFSAQVKCVVIMF